MSGRFWLDTHIVMALFADEVAVNSGVGWAKGLSPCPSPESDQARLNPDLELGRSWLRSLWAGGTWMKPWGRLLFLGPHRVLSGFKLEGWMLEQKLSMGGNLGGEGF